MAVDWQPEICLASTTRIDDNDQNYEQMNFTELRRWSAGQPGIGFASTTTRMMAIAKTQTNELH